MAQQRSFRGLARRYGLGAKVGAGVAAVALVGGLGAFAYANAAAGGVTIERAGENSESVGALENEAAEEATSVEDETNVPAEIEEPVFVVVHVDGAVAAPGVYTLEGTPRVNDAIVAAGGLLAGADTSSINLAALLSDGQKVYVPLEGEDAPAAVDSTATGETSTSVSTTATSTALININTATAEELCELPGVGEATAAAIVEDREANGAFTSIEDIMRVSGIGEKKFAKMQGMICV